MTADVELLPCGECGMPCRPGEYHPYAACLMFKTCRNSDTVRGNLQDAQDHATAAKDAEIEALRADVEDYRTNGAAAVRFAPNSAYWSNELRRLFGDDARTGIEVLENQYRQELTRAERLAEALRELRDLMLGQVKWMPCDCGCPQQRTPDGPHSVTWLRAAQQVEIAISKAEGKE